MTTFLESPRFPDNISYGSSGGPGFNTWVFEGYTGIEQRSITWSRARARYNIEHGIRDKDDMDTLRAFFYEVRGRGLGFRFKDHGDYEATDEVCGTGDGSNNTFRLYKTYGATNSYVRRIFKPVSGTLTIKSNGSTVAIGAGASQVAVDYTTGTLTFGASAIPGVGHSVTWTGEFDVPCRFDTDVMSATHDGWLTESWSGVPVVEILLED